MTNAKRATKAAESGHKIKPEDSSEGMEFDLEMELLEEISEYDEHEMSKRCNI